MIKTVSQQAKRKTVDPKAAEALANTLADKPYGKEKTTSQKEEPLERITFTMPQSMYDELEELAKKRKRAKHECRSMAAIARTALEEYLKTVNSKQ